MFEQAIAIDTRTAVLPVNPPVRPSPKRDFPVNHWVLLTRDSESSHFKISGCERDRVSWVKSRSAYAK